ncbi:MAG: hypothetical protein E6J31_00475 [Chloroflexi bacterium]|nr:MAG: hypothetical protein E6J31_00475 [Chloroflexota bacterium]
MGKTRIRPFMTAILLAVTFLGTVLVLSPLSSALAASHSSVAGQPARTPHRSSTVLPMVS